MRIKFIQKNSLPCGAAQLVVDSYCRSHVFCPGMHKLSLTIVTVAGGNEASQSIGLFLPDDFSKTVGKGT